MTMRINARRIATAAAPGVVALLALAGCAKVDVALSIHGDTVDGTMIMAVDRRLASGGDAILNGLEANAPDDVAGVTKQPFADQTYIGSRYLLDDVPISEFDSGPGSLGIKHDKSAGTYTFSGELDLTALNPQGFTAELASSLDVRISITFPGRVIRHNGELDGNTVTWRAQPGQKLVVEAVAEEHSSFPWMVVVAVGLPILLVVAGLIVWLVRRKGSAEPASPLPPPSDPLQTPSDPFQTPSDPFTTPAEPFTPAADAMAPPRPSEGVRANDAGSP